LVLVRDYLGNVQTFGIEDAAFGITHGNHFHSNLVQQLSGDAAGIAKPLDCCRRMLVIDLFDLAGAANYIDAAAGCGFMASERTAKKSRFARDHAGNAMAARHAVSVHNPRHDLSIGINVGSGNVAVGTDEVRDFVSVAPGKALKFTTREILGIADDAAL